MSRKLTKKELRQRGMEYKQVWMHGYAEGYKAAMPMHEFVHFLMEIGEPRTVKKVKDWAAKEDARLQAEKKKVAK